MFPDLWSEVSSLPAWDATALKLHPDQVRSAFSRLFKCPTWCDHSSFCFFIDGLDEYEETRQDDFKELVRLLSGWADAAPHGVKLCVSSREENVFLNFFSDDKRLLLQDLTRGDMEHYVRERLRDLDPEDLDRVAKVITQRASGIFFWVALIAKSIRARLEDGFDASPATIEQQVISMPDELEGLFQHLLGSIDKSYRKQAYQTFALVQLGHPYLGSNLTFEEYSFLDDYNVDREFAQKPDFPYATLTTTARSQRTNNAQRKLNAQCKGLVGQGKVFEHLVFTHRSIADWLGDYLPESLVAKSLLAGFDPDHALPQLVLARVRSRPRDQYWITKERDGQMSTDNLMSTIFPIIMRNRYMDSPPYTFLEALRLAATEAIPESLFLPRNDLLGICVSLGRHEYLDWVISVDPSVIDNANKIALLVCKATSSLMSWEDCPEEPSVRILATLLKRGISPNTAIDATSEGRKRRMPKGMTFWEYIVSGLCYLPFAAIRRTGWAIPLFLAFGANSDIRIEPVSSPIPTKDSERVRTLEASRSRPKSLSEISDNRCHDLDGFARPAFKFQFGNGIGEHKTVIKEEAEYWGPWHHGIDFLDFIVDRGGVISFEDFVRFHDFETKEAILALCARNRRALAAPTDTTPAPGTDETENPEVPENTNEKDELEADTAAHDSPPPEAEVPLAAHEESPSKFSAQTQALFRHLRKSRVFDVVLGKSIPQTKLGRTDPSLTVHCAPAILAVLVLSQLVPVLGLQWGREARGGEQSARR